MKSLKKIIIILNIGILVMFTSCKNPITELTYDDPDTKIIFLHHSTGRNVWYGDVGMGKSFGQKLCMVPRLIKEYNDQNGRKISIEERDFPAREPYGWKNYPYDYYNIWVKNAGNEPFMEEPTLEMLTKEFDVIIFKHCFPVSNIEEDDGNPDINSDKQTITNFKLQYDTLRTKLYEFPKTKFIVWTGAALVEPYTNPEEASRAREFFKWVKEEWDQPGDNIEIFDFREIETEGGIYLKSIYAANPQWDSHPNKKLSKIAAQKFVDKIIEVVK